MPSRSTSIQPGRRAVLYMRMSTDRQRYSIENQSFVLYAYAVEHNLEVLKQFRDEAKSGLTFAGRPAMKALIDEVKSGYCGFEFILTYDVSRWGRFQNVDESAFYEHLCLQAGVRVIYCAENFNSYEGPISAVLKSIKRTLAAEYSADLSQKITDARMRMARDGLHLGSRLKYGLRRVVVSREGETIGTIEDGCHRCRAGDRVVIRPGPEEELVNIRRIFDLYLKRKLSFRAIKARLNNYPIYRLDGKPWSADMVRRLIADECYIGNLVFKSFHTKGQIKRSKQPTQVIRHEKVFDPIVPVNVFHAAAKRRRELLKPLGVDDMIKKLQDFYAKNGKVSVELLSKSPDIPVASTYRRYFGTLVDACHAAGLPPSACTPWVEYKMLNKKDCIKIMNLIAQTLQTQGHDVELDYKHSICHVNGKWCMHIRLVRAKRYEGGKLHWSFRLSDSCRADILFLLRLDELGCELEDMYLVPMLSIRRMPTRVSTRHKNNLGTDMYRITAISGIAQLAERYINDVEDYMVQFGHTQEDMDLTRIARNAWKERKKVEGLKDGTPHT
jgi:DNA invertase Pin-like site-specific DNA recombinase